MTILTLDANAAGHLESWDASYALARAGTGANLDVKPNIIYVGQYKSSMNYYLDDEAFISFDTSALGRFTHITSITLRFYLTSDESTVDFTGEARLHDWGESLTGADWVAGASLSGKPLLASIGTSGWGAVGSYKTFTCESSFASLINRTGYTRIVLCSSRQRNGDAPTYPNHEQATFGFPTNPPQLVIEYESTLAGAELQGIATLEAKPLRRVYAGTTLQGVTKLEAGFEGAHAHNFAQYDAFIEDADDNLQGLLYFEGKTSSETDETKKRITSRALQATRSDTGNNPNEIRPEYGNYFSQSDFSHGANQRWYNHTDADPKRYLRSEGFDISEPGQLTHLHDTAAVLSDTAATILAQANGLPFVASGTVVKVGDTALENWTPEDQEPGETNNTVYDLASSGSELYAAVGVGGVHVRDTGGTWTHYNDVEATRLAWLKDRLIASDGTKVYEVISEATPTEIEELPSGWTFESFFEAGNFVYACAINETAVKSSLHIYGPNAEMSALEKKGSQEFPEGQLIRSGRGYLNVILLGAGIKNANGGFDPILYRATPDDSGFLEYAEIAEDEGSGAEDLSVRAFAALGKSMIFGWSLGADSTMAEARGGLGIYGIGFDAFSGYLKGSSAADPVPSLMVYQGRVVFVLEGIGVFAEDPTKLAPEATLITSVCDWSNAGQKAWDLIEITHTSLPADTRVSVSYALEIPDAETEWYEAFTSATTGSDGSSISLHRLTSRLLALKIVSGANTAQTAAPEIVSYSVRSNPTLETPEFLLTRFIRLQDQDKKDDTAESITQDASAILKYLLGLVYSPVKLYEPGFSWTARIEGVEETDIVLPPYDPTGENARDFYVLQLVLSGTLI